MVVATGVGGADVRLRDGSGGVGGRYVYKNEHQHPQEDGNVLHHTHLGGTRYRRGRFIRDGGDHQSFRPVVKTRRRHVFLVRRIIKIAGSHPPKVHFVKRRLILIGLSDLRLRHRFDPIVRRRGLKLEMSW